MEAMGAVENVVTLDIPAKPEYVAVGRLALAALLREAAFSDDAVADMKLALTEACSNSIRHAFGEANGQVHLTFTLDGERLVLGVRDEGIGFAEEEVEAAAFTPGSTTNLPEGGMGFSIIRAVVDEFTLEHPVAGGTQLTMTKLKRA